MLKIGQKVRIKWEKTGYIHFLYENKGVITGIDEGAYPYRVEGFYPNYPNYSLHFKENQLEPIGEEVNMKFKVGKRVKVTKKLHPLDEGWLGEEGRITKMKAYNAYPYLVEAEDGDSLFFSASQLKLVGKEVTMENAKFGTKFEEDQDPVEFYKTRKEAEERINELLDDLDVNKSEIYLFEVGKVWKVERPITFKLIELVKKVKKGRPKLQEV